VHQFSAMANIERISYFCRHARSIMPTHDSRHGGVSHTVEVTAATLYEGSGPRLAALSAFGASRPTIGLPGIAQVLNIVKISVTEVRVEHEVKMMDFTKWFDRTGGSPREVNDRHRIRYILGYPLDTHAPRSGRCLVRRFDWNDVLV